MIKEVKQYGGSVVIILDKSARKYFDIKVGDFVDVSDMVKVKPREQK